MPNLESHGKGNGLLLVNYELVWTDLEYFFPMEMHTLHST